MQPCATTRPCTRSFQVVGIPQRNRVSPKDGGEWAGVSILRRSQLHSMPPSRAWETKEVGVGKGVRGVCGGVRCGREGRCTRHGTERVVVLGWIWGELDGGSWEAMCADESKQINLHCVSPMLNRLSTHQHMHPQLSLLAVVPPA